jgi:hypothetical protein
LARTKQNREETKPFSCSREDVRKRELGIDLGNEKAGRKGPMTGEVMIKAISAIAVAALIATALTALPGFAPQVKASVPQALAKGDRLDIRPAGRDCSEQAWPNFEASCLRVAGSRTMIRRARLVTADRGP